MRTILITELDTEFLVQGLGLRAEAPDEYSGKVGRHEVRLYAAGKSLASVVGETQVLMLGSAAVANVRPGDILMFGKNELLDRAFQALDEMEQRGVVVGIAGIGEPNQVELASEGLSERVMAWEAENIPYLGLFAAEPLDSEAKAILVTLVRKVLG